MNSVVGSVKEGDYVLVDKRGGHKGTTIDYYVGRVYKEKVYTGIRCDGRYLHKLTCLCRVPEEDVSSETKRKILRDLAIHFPEEFKYPDYPNVYEYMNDVFLSNAERISKAFGLCRNVKEVQDVCNRLNLGYGSGYGDYSFDADEFGYTVFVEKGNCHTELPFTSRKFVFNKETE